MSRGPRYRGRRSAAGWSPLRRSGCRRCRTCSRSARPSRSSEGSFRRWPCRGSFGRRCESCDPLPTFLPSESRAAWQASARLPPAWARRSAPVPRNWPLRPPGTTLPPQHPACRFSSSFASPIVFWSRASWFTASGSPRVESTPEVGSCTSRGNRKKAGGRRATQVGAVQKAPPFRFRMGGHPQVQDRPKSDPPPGPFTHSTWSHACCI